MHGVIAPPGQEGWLRQRRSRGGGSITSDRIKPTTYFAGSNSIGFSKHAMLDAPRRRCPAVRLRECLLQSRWPTDSRDIRSPEQMAQVQRRSSSLLSKEPALQASRCEETFVHASSCRIDCGFSLWNLNHHPGCASGAATPVCRACSAARK